MQGSIAGVICIAGHKCVIPEDEVEHYGEGIFYLCISSISSTCIGIKREATDTCIIVCNSAGVMSCMADLV